MTSAGKGRSGRCGWPLALAVLGFVLAASSLGSGLHMDDWTNIWNGRRSTWAPEDLGSHFVHGARLSQDGYLPQGYDRPVAWYFRPVLVALFKVEGRLFGTKAWPYHAVNLLFHGANALLLAAVIRRLGGSRRAACWAPVLFLFHAPAGVACAWVSGRTELVMAFFLLAAFLCYARFRDGEGRPFLLASLGLAALAMGAKEQAVLLPLLLAVYDRLVHRDRRFTLHPLLFVGLLFAVTAYRLSLPGVSQLPPATFYFHPPGEEGFFRYVVVRGCQSLLALFQVLPFSPMAYGILLRWQLWFPLVLGGAFLALFLSRNLARRPEQLFFALWMVLFTLPTLMCSPLPLYLYVPALGACALVGSLAEGAARDGDAPFLRRHRRGFLLFWLAVGTAAMIYTNGWLRRASVLQRDLVEGVRLHAPPSPAPLRIHLFGCTLHMSASRAMLRLAFPHREPSFHGMTMSHRFMGRRAQTARWLPPRSALGEGARLRVDVGTVHPTRNPLFDSIFTRPLDFDVGDSVSTKDYSLTLQRDEAGYWWDLSYRRPLASGDLFFLALPDSNRHVPHPGQGEKETQ